MENTAENAKLIKEYLQGARELEWDRYTMQSFGDKLREKISACRKKKDDAEKELQQLQKSTQKLEADTADYKQPEYKKSSYSMEFEFDGQAYLIALFLWSVLSVVCIFLSEGKGIKGFGFMFAIEQFFARLTSGFWGVVIHFAVLPAVIYLAAQLIIQLIRRSAYEKREERNEAAHNAREEAKEAESKAKWRAEVKENEGRIAELQEQISGLDSVVLPGLEQELEINDSAVLRASADLDKYYGAGVLHPKYRGLVPVSTICEYFETGRTDTLSGHTGAYNLYESEYRLNMINSKLDTIQQQLQHISSQNAAMQRSLADLTSTVGSLVDSVDDCTAKNLSCANDIRYGVQKLQHSAQARGFYEYSASNALRHLDRMASVEYYSRHLI